VSGDHTKDVKTMENVIVVINGAIVEDAREAASK